MDLSRCRLDLAPALPDLAAWPTADSAIVSNLATAVEAPAEMFPLGDLSPPLPGLIHQGDH